MKNKDGKRSWMETYAPPGISFAREVTYWKLLMIAGTLWSMLFLLQYVECRNALYKTVAGKKVLIEGAMMPTFEDLMTGRLELFYLVIIYCIIIAAYHYFYHYQGSRMMYLMKRLPNKWEVHVRCLSLPTCGSVIAVIVMLVLKMVYYTIYTLCTPSQCLML